MNEIVVNDIRTLNLDKSTWKPVRFGEVAIQQKQSVDRDTTNITRYIKGEHMKSEDLHLRNWGDLTDEYLGPAFVRRFEIGDILYGSRRTYLKKVAIAHFEGITSNTTFVIKANEEVIDKNLLPFIMLSEGFTQHSIRNSKGSVNPYINWKDLAKYEFLLPPKDQQAQLAELLWAMDEVVKYEIEVLRKLILKEKVTIEELVSGKRTLDVTDEKFTFSESKKSTNKWKLLSLELLCEKVTDGEHLSPNFVGEGYPILSAKDIQDDGVQMENAKFIAKEAFQLSRRRCNPEYNDVLIVSRGATIGRTTVNKISEPFALMGSVILLKPKSTILGDYLGLLVKRKSYQNRLLAISGSTAQQAIYLADIKKSKLAIPPISYQKLIVKFVEKISNSIYSIKTKIASSKALQKSLINQIF
ncbi:MAG: restriction endonuclease subunit S [Saprospiraceae bacterium]|nr:restriction endonuclease subunit S [Saprospiraceae bacterium]